MNYQSGGKILTLLKAKLEYSNKYEEFEKNFSGCSTDAQRIAYLDSVQEVQDLFTVGENYLAKNEQDAEIMRAEGNKFFKEGNYQTATEKYTKSILKAPVDSSNLSLAYGNRSTASFYLKRYCMCLQDIELAFLHNYPKSTCYKLYQRLGRCMYYLRCKVEAIKAFQQTIAVLKQTPEIDEKNKQEMIEDMTKAIVKCDAITHSSQVPLIWGVNECHQRIPDLSSDPSLEVPCLSEDVEIRLDHYGGRGLFAKRNIDIGEVLIVETPYSSVLLKEFNLTHCQFCCNRVLLPVPCRQCSGVVFCSLKCRDEAWEKCHWAECKILEGIQDCKGDLGMLATRMIVCTEVKDLVKISDSESNSSLEPKTGFNEEGVYSSVEYRSAYSLVNHAEDRTVKDLLTRTISALFFLKHLECTEFFSKQKLLDAKGINLSKDSSEILKQKHCVGGHILRNIMMLPCNAHEVSEFSLNISNPPMSCVLELAAAIYPVLSLINHSCDPSVVRQSFGNVCVARAIRSIPAGAELKDNYGAIYPTMDIVMRQSDLLSQYYFHCDCEACRENWPLYFDIPSDRPVFRCVQCEGRVPIPLSNLTELAKCESCSHSQDITQNLLYMGEMESAYKDALTAVIDGDISAQNIHILLTYLRYVEDHVKRPWRDINDSQEAIKQCLNMQANCYPAQI